MKLPIMQFSPFSGPLYLSLNGPLLWVLQGKRTLLRRKPRPHANTMAIQTPNAGV
jgi:hypothetical protein